MICFDCQRNYDPYTHPGIACPYCEIERLLAVVDKLPETKDGVRVVPGADLVWHPMVASNVTGELSPLNIHASGMASWWRQPDIGFDVSDCYSTREAAEKAKEKEHGPEND